LLQDIDQLLILLHDTDQLCILLEGTDKLYYITIVYFFAGYRRTIFCYRGQTNCVYILLQGTEKLYSILLQDADKLCIPQQRTDALDFVAGDRPTCILLQRTYKLYSVTGYGPTVYSTTGYK
jgi:hypothetical protein